MSSAPETDVLIVGGGPAGLAAAIASRQKGLLVMVADRAHPPIEKPCGEGLMPDAVDALRELGVTISPDHSFPFRGIRFLAPGTSVSANFPSGYGWGVRRAVLHQLLVDRAASDGVQFLWNARVSSISVEGTTVDDRLIRSRWIVGADGQNSYVRRWADLDASDGSRRRFGFRQHYLIKPWSDCVEVYWGKGFQFYITPVSHEEVCVVLISRNRHLRIGGALTDFPDLSAHLKSAQQTGVEQGAVSVSRSYRQVFSGHIALVGDASGSVDAVTGEGLCLAFRQGGEPRWRTGQWWPRGVCGRPPAADAPPVFHGRRHAFA
jgi:flavin-dependent dehydrogenase